MKAFVFALALVGSALVASEAVQACDGPNCQQRSLNGYGPTRSPFDAAFGAGPSSWLNRVDLTACGCNSCDPRFPCSPTTCAQKGCQDCGASCPTCPTSRGGVRPAQFGAPALGNFGNGQQTLPRTVAAKLCPVTGEKLGSMGPPIPVSVMGKTIYVCCEACVGAVRRNPEKYLSTNALPRNTLPTTNRPAWNREVLWR